MTNHRTPDELRLALEVIIAELKALDTAIIADIDLVPLLKTIQNTSMYAATLDAQIQLRVIGNGVSVPGVARKPGITHRKWNDEKAAGGLAFEAFGLDAFKLLSPAAIEKLGDEGKALVSIASTKPDAQDRVIY